MADFNFFNDDDAIEETETTGTLYQGTDSAIIALQVSEDMFETKEGEDRSNFQKVFDSIKNMMRNKIICSENELQGVVLFGTEKQKNSTNFKNVYIWLDIDIPSAKRIEEIDIMMTLTKEEYESEYGFCEDYKLSDVIWTVSSLFSNAKKKLAIKNFIIITSNDEPHHGDKNLILRAKTKAKDAMDQGIDIQVVSFNTNFNLSKFYKDIVTFDIENVDNPIENIENLYDCLLRKCTKQRPVSSINFELADGVQIPVAIYTSIRQATKGSAINIYEQSNKEATMKSNIVESSTGSILLPSDIKVFQTWGERQVVFETAEVQEIRKLSNPSLKLLCFKKKDTALKPTYHVKSAQYLALNNFSGDCSTLFHLIHKKCSDKELVAICSYMSRSNATVAPVALLPNTATDDVAPGFHVIFLPMSDDIRSLDIPKTNASANVEQVQAAENIIRKLKFSYTPSNFDNPALQKHYRYLEALALDSDAPDPVKDLTLPDLDRIRNKTQPQIDHFKSLVFSEESLKRKLTGDAGKKAKVPRKDNGDANSIDVEEYAKQGKLNKLTVATLKTICQTKGFSTSGRKADLIKTIESYLL